MARSKTGSFWLTETVRLSDNTIQQGTIDLGSYVDVGDQQAIAVEEVDFVVQWQDTTATATNFYYLPGGLIGNALSTFAMQLTDLSRGTTSMVVDNDRALVASGSLNIDAANNITSIGPNVYPDTYGKLDEARMVVNDQLYCTAQLQGSAVASADDDFLITFRIKCRIVKLDKRDWMSIAIQSTAADN